MTNRHPRARLRWWRFFLAAVVAVATLLGPAGTAWATPGPPAETRVGAFADFVAGIVGPAGSIGAGQRLGEALPEPGIASATGVAAKSVDIGGAKFAQNSFSETFSKGGLFEGRTIDDVAGSLRSGALSSKDVPIDVIVRDGSTLILNTRSSQALIRAGIPRDAWNVIDRTGQAAFEARLSGQLGRNGLTSSGTDLP